MAWIEYAACESGTCLLCACRWHTFTRGPTEVARPPPPHSLRTQQQQQNWLRQRQSEMDREATLSELRREGGAPPLASRPAPFSLGRRRCVDTLSLFPFRTRPAPAVATRPQLLLLRRRPVLLLPLRPQRRRRLLLAGPLRQPARPIPSRRRLSRPWRLRPGGPRCAVRRRHPRGGRDRSPHGATHRQAASGAQG